MATDGRKRAAQSVWERLDAEKAGAAGRPFDEHGSDWVAEGVGAMPAKLSEEEERAQWAADLAAVAEQRHDVREDLERVDEALAQHDPEQLGRGRPELGVLLEQQPEGRVEVDLQHAAHHTRHPRHTMEH